MSKNIPPDIAVLIPNHNRAAFIWQAVESVRAAQLEYDADLRLKVFIVDDASSDDSWDVIEKLSNEFSDDGFEIDIQRQPENGGVNSVLNDLILHAKNSSARMSFVLDSDDYLCPNFFNHTVPILEARHPNSNLGFVYTDMTLVTEDGDPICMAITEDFNRATLRAKSYIPQPSLILTEALAHCWPLNARVQTETTHYRFLKICSSEREWEGVRVAKPGFLYRMHRGNISNAQGILEDIQASNGHGQLRSVEVSGLWEPYDPKKSRPEP